MKFSADNISGGENSLNPNEGKREMEGSKNPPLFVRPLQFANNWRKVPILGNFIGLRAKICKYFRLNEKSFENFLIFSILDLHSIFIVFIIKVNSGENR